jgi:F-type H+-transporting ATPase subunit epsilon
MARNRFIVEVLTPEGEVFNEEVEMVSTRTTTGSIGLLANHEPLLARLEPTELRLYRSETEIVRYAQAEGYVQMAENRALLLVEEAIDPARLNAAELQERVAAAQRAGEAAPAGTEEAARAARDLRRAEAFLAIAGGAHQ